MTRTGKIARLPRTVRDELNRRLYEGESGPRLVAWLNELPRVKKALGVHFKGRPVTEQNLSEWRQGGYACWCRHQESQELMGQTIEQAVDLEEMCGEVPITDRMAEALAMTLFRQLHVVEAMADGPDKIRRTLDLVGALLRLRRTDHARQREQREEGRRNREKVAERRQDRDAAQHERLRAEHLLRPLGAQLGRHFDALHHVRAELQCREESQRALPSYLTMMVQAMGKFERFHSTALQRMEDYDRHQRRGQLPDKEWFRELEREAEAFVAATTGAPKGATAMATVTAMGTAGGGGGANPTKSDQIQPAPLSAVGEAAPQPVVPITAPQKGVAAA